MVSPLPDERIRYVEELHDSHYTLGFTALAMQNQARNLVAWELSFMAEGSSTRKHLEGLNRMIQTSMIYPSIITGGNDVIFLSGSRLARFSIAFVALAFASRRRAYLKQMKMLDFKCYIGERQELTRTLHFHAAPAESRRNLRRIFLMMLGGGIWNFWKQEYYKTLVHARVQDRPNFADRSFSNLPTDVVSWKPQRLSDGKFKQIFVLWGLSLLLGLLVLVLETASVHGKNENLDKIDGHDVQGSEDEESIRQRIRSFMMSHYIFFNREYLFIYIFGTAKKIILNDADGNIIYETEWTEGYHDFLLSSHFFESGQLQIIVAIHKANHYINIIQQG